MASSWDRMRTCGMRSDQELDNIRQMRYIQQSMKVLKAVQADSRCETCLRRFSRLPLEMPTQAARHLLERVSRYASLCVCCCPQVEG